MIIHVQVRVWAEIVILLLYFHIYLIAELLFFPFLVLYKLVLDIVLLLLEVEPVAIKPASDSPEFVVVQVC